MKFLIGILGLGFLVFFHETGHFIAARIFGVKVEAFSVGMGPVLLHKKWGYTDYRLSLIPLGGYCSMKGEEEFQKALDEGKKEISGDKDSFYGVHPFKRLLIALAGPAANFILGYIAFVIIAMMGYTFYSAGLQVNMADEVFSGTPSPAHEAGMQSGDTIVAIDGIIMEDFNDAAQYISLHPDQDITITVLRNQEQLDIQVHSLLDRETGAGKIGISAREESVTQKEYKAKSFFPALKEGAIRTNQLVGSIFKSIGILFKGVKITSAVSGPARVTGIFGEAVQEGFSASFHAGVISTLEILALISLSLFFTNLLPIPVLDGGLILFAIIETITRKKMQPKALLIVQYVGLSIIALIFILAMIGDIQYFIGN